MAEPIANWMNKYENNNQKKEEPMIEEPTEVSESEEVDTVTRSPRAEKRARLEERMANAKLLLDRGHIELAEEILKQ